MLAAGFLFWATKTPLYLADAEEWQSQLVSTNDPSVSTLAPSYDNNYWAANVALYHITGDKSYRDVSPACPCPPESLTAPCRECSHRALTP